MARKTVLRNIRESLTTAFGGLRGGQNLAAWTVAGVVAYYLWVKPEWEVQQEREEKAAMMRENDRHLYVERTRPQPDPQERGLIRGKVKDTS